MRNSKNKNFYISISGVMGAGKTTFSRNLAKELGWHFFEEQVNKNTFLPLYYQDPKRWALHSQIFYLKEKVNQLSEIKKLLTATNVVQDTPIYQDCFTYAKAQHLLGYMNDDEHELYLKLFETYHQNLPKPRLIIELQTSVPTLQNRIKKRARNFEKLIENSYLALLAKLQKEWIAAHPRLKVITIKVDNNKFDLEKNPYRSEVLEKIKSALGGGHNLNQI